MKYYTKEIWNEEGYQRTAGIKARDDVDKILEKNGYDSIGICMPSADREGQSLLEKAGYHLKLSRAWNECLKPVGKDDILVIQFPIVNHSVLQHNTTGTKTTNCCHIVTNKENCAALAFADILHFTYCFFLEFGITDS